VLPFFPLRNGLALVFEAQGKLSDAEPLFRRALQGNVAKYGASAAQWYFLSIGLF